MRDSCQSNYKWWEDCTEEWLTILADWNYLHLKDSNNITINSTYGADASVVVQ